jgi:hypothetical protein
VVLAHRRPRSEPSQRALLAVADRCWRQGVALLRVRLADGQVEVGPYVRRGTTACLACLTQGDLATIAGSDEVVDAVELGLAAGVAARDVFALISRSTPVSLPTR